MTYKKSLARARLNQSIDKEASGAHAQKPFFFPLAKAKGIFYWKLFLILFIDRMTEPL